MLKIITSFIHKFIDKLAYKAEKDPLYIAIDKSLDLLDPKGQKAKNINSIVTFTVQGLDLNRGIGFLSNTARTIDFRLDSFKKIPEATKVVKIYEDIKKLYNEAIDYGNKAIKTKSQDEKDTLLNTVTKNILAVKNMLKENEQLITQFQ